MPLTRDKIHISKFAVCFPIKCVLFLCHRKAWTFENRTWNPCPWGLFVASFTFDFHRFCFRWSLFALRTSSCV